MANAAKANAAQEILDFMNRGGRIYEDFSFRGSSDNVGRWCDEIADGYYDGGWRDARAYLRKVIADNRTNSSGQVVTGKSDKALAAQEIYNFTRNGGNLFEDFSFRGMSNNASKWNDELADEFYNAGNQFNRDSVLRFLSGAVSDNSRATETVRHPESDGQERPPVIKPNRNDSWEYTQPTSSPSVTWSPVPPGTVIEVQVRAIDRFNNASAWTESVLHETADDDIPPPKPSKVLISPRLGQLYLSWDGKAA